MVDSFIQYIFFSYIPYKSEIFYFCMDVFSLYGGKNYRQEVRPRTGPVKEDDGMRRGEKKKKGAEAEEGGNEGR